MAPPSAASRAKPAATGETVEAGAPIEFAALSTLSAPWLQEQIASTLEARDCGRVETSLVDGRVRVEGHVPGAKSRDEIATRLEALTGAPAELSALEIIEEPFCGLLEASLGDTSDGRPSIRLNHPDGDYLDGDFLVVRAAAPPDESGFLYVDYVDIDGTVVHMLPSRFHELRPLKPGEALQLGVQDPRLRGDRYELTAPFGRAMVIAHWSEEPLFDTPRPEVERASDYLPDLTAALSSKAVDVRKSHAFIVIKPRQE